MDEEDLRGGDVAAVIAGRKPGRRIKTLTRDALQMKLPTKFIQRADKFDGT